MSISVNFKQLKKYAIHTIMAGHPTMIRGRHGIGKSEAVYQLLGEIAWNDKSKRVVHLDENDCSQLRYEMVERRVSQMTEGDLLGIPDPQGFNINGESASKFRPFSWLVTACTQPCILFLDELDRGIAEVRQGFFELADSRKIAGWTLHPGTVIVAAINGGEESEDYQVNELDPAEADRWTMFDLRPSVEDWVLWAKDSKVNNIAVEFIQQNPQFLEFNGEIEPSKKYPSRRSWARFSKCLEMHDYFSEPESTDITILGESYIGFEAARAFSDFVVNYHKNITPEDIIIGGKWHKTKEWSNEQHIALVTKILDSEFFVKNKSKIGENEILNLAKYFCLYCPSECAVIVYRCILPKDGDTSILKAFNNVVFEHDGQTYRVEQITVKLLAGVSNDE